MTLSSLPACVELPGDAPSGAPCPACGARAGRALYRLRDIPVHSNILLPTREQALAYPKGDLELVHCRSCGFLHNPLFDPARASYGPAYEETQGYSATFRAFVGELVAGLVERHGLGAARVLEIGCGKGEFLAELCHQARCRGVGYDPTIDPTRVGALAGVELRARPYGAADAGESWDLVCCRHTLEHIHDVAAFVTMLRKNLGPRRTPVFFEVPDVLRELEEGAFWDIYYEHCSYFGPGSLARLFRAADFAIEGLELAYGSQYVLLHARSGASSSASPGPLEQDLERTVAAVERFAQSVGQSLRRWHAFLQGCRARDESVVLWGSGSKGVGFLTTLGLVEEVREVVDINPHKRGRYMAGTGQRIVAPEELPALRPAHVIVMNPVYENEIRADLERLGLRPLLHCL